MSTGNRIRAGRAFVELFADDSKLVRGLKAAQAKLKAFGASVRSIGTKMMGLGGAVVAPLALAAKSFADMGSALWDMSQRTGVSVEALSVLGYAAEQSGAGLESLETGLRKMQKTIVDAAKGSKSAQEALAILGLTVRELEGLSPQEQFAAIGDQLDKISDPTLRAATAMGVFGKSGTDLLPMLAGGSAAMNEYEKHARKLGLVMSTKDAQAADAFGDALSDLWKTLKMAVVTIGGALAPSLQAASEWIAKIVATASAWLRKNKELVVTIFKVAVGVVAAGAALVGLGYAISGVSAVFGALVTVAGVVHAALATVGAVIGFLLTPIGLVIGAVAGLGAYFLYSSGAIGKAMDWLSGGFAELASDAMTSFGAIGKALASGNIALAAKVLWGFLKMEWEKGCAVLEKAWLEFRNFFIRIGYDAFYGLVAIGEYAWHGLEVAWIETTSFLSQTWTKFTGWVTKAWNTCGNALTKAWNKIKGVFDSSFDADAANAAADQAYEAGIQQIEQQTNAKITERENLRQAERDKAKQIHDATLQIGQESLDKEKALDEEYNKRLAASQSAVDAAKADWEKAIQEVNSLPTKSDREGPGGMKDPSEFLKNVNLALAGVGDMLDKQERQIAARGTFNAAAMLSLQTSPTDERIAKASEETARNTRELSKRSGQLVFA